MLIHSAAGKTTHMISPPAQRGEGYIMSIGAGFGRKLISCFDVRKVWYMYYIYYIYIYILLRNNVVVLLVPRLTQVAQDDPQPEQ
jgi:hypothetical protein